MAHDNHSQLFTEILQLMYLYKCADGIDVIQSSHHFSIVPNTPECNENMHIAQTATNLATRDAPIKQWPIIV